MVCLLDTYIVLILIIRFHMIYVPCKISSKMGMFDFVCWVFLLFCRRICRFRDLLKFLLGTLKIDKDSQFESNAILHRSTFHIQYLFCNRYLPNHACVRWLENDFQQKSWLVKELFGECFIYMIIYISCILMR